MGWLLQTDPEKRPNIDQVLTHPAIQVKVKELQVLYPAPLSTNIRRLHKNKNGNTILPISEKKSGIQKDVKMIKSNKAGNNTVTSINMKPKVEEPDKSKFSSNKRKNSISDIEKLKKLTQNKNLNGTPRPNMLPAESPKDYRSSSKQLLNENKVTSFKKNNQGMNDKSNENYSSKRKESDSKLYTNQSINSRTDRINKLLSHYGKHSETPKSKYKYYKTNSKIKITVTCPQVMINIIMTVTTRRL